MSWERSIGLLNKACINAFAGRKVILYKHSTGEEYQIKGIFDRNFSSVDPDSGAIIISNNPILSITEKDLIKLPDEGDSVSIGGVNYRILEAQPDSEGMSKLILREL